MTHTGQTTLDSVRGQAHEILDRARNDAEFLTQLRSDPQATLRSAGFSEDGVIDFGREVGDADEIRGYAFQCDRISCIISWCWYIPLTNIRVNP
jgi:hypothetical protein